jgi:tetratricopeptide (TPR) repeat protein
LLSSTIKNFANSDSEQQLIWQGMQMFTQQSAKLSDPRLQSVYDHFESNLKDTVEVLEGNGMHVILSTVPVNLRKQAPFSSDHTVKPDTLNLGRWQNLYEQSLQEQSDKNWPATEQTLRKMLEISPDYAESHFQLAVALENQEKWGESREHFFLARDLDTLRFRADSNINRVIRSVAEGTSSEDLTLVDAEQAFSDHSAPSPPGFNLFLEHVHYTVHGNYILAREFGAAILRRLDSSPQPNSISEASISDLIGYPSYETLGNLERLYAMTENPPFKGQSNHRELLSFLTTEISNSKKRLGTTKNIILKRRAILNSPHVDWRIFFELGVLAEEQNNKNTAINFFEKAFEAHPHNRETHLKLANLYSGDDQWNKALFYLERSLHYTRGNRNQIAETLGRLGTTQIKLNHFTEGKSVLKRLISNYPDQIDHYLRAHANLVRLAAQESDEKLASDYMLSARSYAEELIAQGEDSKYPELKLRVAQILTMGGRDDLALEWYRPEK